MNMPNILMETSYGYSSCRIEDSLMQRRAVLCFGAITPEQADSLILQLLYLSTQSDQEITLYIHSPGGEVNSGFAIYDAMKLLGCPIRTVCVGIRTEMAHILSNRTGRTVEEILEKTEQETTFNAHEAVEFGLADQILTDFSGLPRPEGVN